MLRIQPFRAIRPKPSRAAQVASVPYDVVSTAEARELASGRRTSFLHIVRSEIDLPEDSNPYHDSVYAKARENLDRFLDDGVLVRDDTPRMYLYRQAMRGRTQIGLVCCCHIDDYAKDLIKKHEKTRPEKEDDRTRHMLALNAHPEPVFLAYRDEPTINLFVEDDTNDRPLFHFVAEDGVTHTVWAVPNAQRYVDAFTTSPGVPHAYIADGHHRTASAVRAGMERRSANPNHTGNEEYNWFLSVLFPASQLRILPYNRVVSDLNGLTPAEFLDKLRGVGDVQPNDDSTPKHPGSVCFYLDKTWRTLTIESTEVRSQKSEVKDQLLTSVLCPLTSDHSDPITSLDVSLLQDRVLSPILGIGDPRTDKRLDFVGGIRGAEGLTQRVDSGGSAVAFSLYPTSMEQLMSVSDAGLIMPPKSTWFEPKLRSGLLIHSLE